MTKIRKFSVPHIKRITGGKDPVNQIEEFLRRNNFDSCASVVGRTKETVSWSLALSEEEELEITLESLNRPQETTLYMGVNIFSVPVIGAHDILAAALIVADTLVGAKLSLVNHDLVLSISSYAYDLREEDIEYYYKFIIKQKRIVIDLIVDELSGV